MELRCLCMETNVERNEQSKENIKETDNQQPPKKYIRCPECGEEILMVPTLGQMIEIIESHVISHRKQTNNDATLAHLKTPTIRVDLTQQVILQASDMIDSSRKPPIWL